MGDCCFIGSMATIAEHPEFVNRFFILTSSHPTSLPPPFMTMSRAPFDARNRVMDLALPDNNLFVINLWWAGDWRRVVIDGCLPVDAHGRTVFASCEDSSRCANVAAIPTVCLFHFNGMLTRVRVRSGSGPRWWKKRRQNSEDRTPKWKVSACGTA